MELTITVKKTFDNRWDAHIMEIRPDGTRTTTVYNAPNRTALLYRVFELEEAAELFD